MKPAVSRLPDVPGSASTRRRPVYFVRRDMGGGVAGSLALFDLNHDGKLDLALLNRRDGFVRLLLGQGSGKFTGGVFDLPGAVAFAPGDFNSDGKSDVAVLRAAPSPLASASVSILLAGKENSFTLGPETHIDRRAQLVIAGDFNGDGKTDLAIADRGKGILVLLGRGDGRFGPPLTVNDTPATTALLSADFNGDGRPDLALLAADSVVVELGMGKGAFKALPALRLSFHPAAFTAGDVDEDGHIDLVISGGKDNKENGSVSVLLGRGDGTFLLKGTGATGHDPQAVALGDLDGDGHLDAAVANHGDATVTVLLGNGHGVLINDSSPEVDIEPQSLVVGDFNGDGRPDLAVSSPLGVSTSLLLARLPPAANLQAVSMDITCSGFTASANGSGIPSEGVVTARIRSRITVSSGQAPGRTIEKATPVPVIDRAGDFQFAAAGAWQSFPLNPAGKHSFSGEATLTINGRVFTAIPIRFSPASLTCTQ